MFSKMGIAGVRSNRSMGKECYSTGEPWLLAEEHFLPVQSRGRIDQLLTAIKKDHVYLSFANADGQVFSRCLLVRIEEDVLTIDRPFEWDGGGGAARIFFQYDDLWHFFPVSNVIASPFSLHVDFPAGLFILQRRRYKRARVPLGSRALIKKDGDGAATVSVRDISAAGMLVCGLANFEEFPVDSMMNDIVVSLPRQGGGEGVHSRKVLPLISRGRVVRFFTDSATNHLCYGISFEHESNYVQEALCRLVVELGGAA